MGNIDAIILGVLQGIAEFLPISSSGHLVLAEKLLGLDVVSLRSFDVVVHMATLLAILIYFWKDILAIIKGFFCIDKSTTGKKNQKLGFYIIIGSIPAVVVGFLLNDIFDEVFRNVLFVGIAMFIVGLVFLAAEKWPIEKNKTDVGLFHAIFICIAQAIAILPGVSRSGSTIAAGLFQGITRVEAARFSFLLGTPVLFGAGILTLKEASFGEASYLTLSIGFLAAFISGFFAISFLMKFLARHKLNIFGIYLISLGIIILVYQAINGTIL